jgi:hypothetical protein
VSSSLKRLLRYEERAKPPEGGREESLLAGIPPDAPMDDAVLAAWNGSRFVAYDKWLATAPIVTDDTPPSEARPNFPPGTDCVVGVCGGTRVWLVKDGDRWLMFAGSRKASGRRRDFASPFMGHAIRTAEQWYGPAADGWRAEGGGQEK